LGECVEGADVMDCGRNRALVVEGEQRHVLHHPRVRFGEKRDVGHFSASGDAIEGDLIGKYRLAGTGNSLHEIHARLEQPATQNLVKPRNTGGDLFETHTTLPSVAVASWRNGSGTTKVDPPRDASRTIDPPCNIESCCAIHNPNPYPAIVLFAFTPRTNFSKMCWRWCSAMPGPESMTRMTALPAP